MLIIRSGIDLHGLECGLLADTLDHLVCGIDFQKLGYFPHFPFWILFHILIRNTKDLLWTGSTILDILIHMREVWRIRNWTIKKVSKWSAYSPWNGKSSIWSLTLILHKELDESCKRTLKVEICQELSEVEVRHHHVLGIAVNVNHLGRQMKEWFSF